MKRRVCSLVLSVLFSSLFLFNTSHAIVSAQELIANYPFSGNTNDESAYSRNGTGTNVSLTTDRSGNADAAYDFNGSNSNIIANSSISGLCETIAFWAKSDIASPQTAIVGTGRFRISFGETTGAVTNEVVTVMWSTDHTRGVCWDTSVFPSGIDTSWHHYCIVWDEANGIYRLYFDGDDKGLATAGSTGNPGKIDFSQYDQALIIGSTDDPAYGYWDGKIDEVRIYNYAISTQEIDALSSSLATPTHLSPADPFYTPVNQFYTCTWSEVSGATGYQWTAGLDPTFSDNPTIHDLSSPSFNTSLQGSYPLSAPMYWRVRAVSASETSAWSSPWRIYTQLDASLTLTSPNGGESWEASSSQNITWTSTGVTNVKLEYSTNSGTDWTEIVASTAASAGSYSWTVPNIQSSNCLVRVSDASDAGIIDQSNAVFTIYQTTPTMVSIPGGSFQMGTAIGDSDEQPVHTVTLSEFEISSTEITQGQYEIVIGSNPSTFKGDMNHPAEHVNWIEAVTFCNMLSTLQGYESCYDLITFECDFEKN